MIKNIFRQYDIRGLVDKDLTDEVVKNIGKAFAVLVQENSMKKVLLGRDNRSSSPHIQKILTDALLESGCDVIDLGMVVTPMFYFAAKHLNLKAGIMITASHNPSEYNGCKILLGESTIYGEQIQDLRKRIEEKIFLNNKPGGQVESIDVKDDYINYLTQKIDLGPNVPKIVVDCGNGTASLFAPALYRKLGCEVIELYCESDPDFPNHHPDPVNPDNMQDLIYEVKKNAADIGIGIDGDGDRLGVVDRKGNMIWGDMLMILFWRDILPRYPGTTCIVEVKCSQSLIDEIERLGGIPLIYKTGHSLIKAKMKEVNAVFTGEMSGHIFFADDYFGYDDALYAGARLLTLLSKSEETIDEMLNDVPKYYSTPEIRLKSTDEEKFTIVEQVKKHFRKNYEIIDIDGARIIFPDGWALVRASNTGPEIIFRCEGQTPEAMAEIKNAVFAYFKSIDFNAAD